MKELNHILERCCREIPSVAGIALIEISTGRVISAIQRDPNINLLHFSPQLAEAARRHQSAIESIGNITGPSEDLIFNTPKGLFILHIFGASNAPSHLIALVAGRLANPGMIRLVLATYESRLLDVL